MALVQTSLVSVRSIVVAVLAGLAALCQLIAGFGAWHGMNRVRRLRERLAQARQANPVRYALAAQPTGVNMMDVCTALEELQRLPDRFSLRTVGVIAPVGVLLGFAAALVSVW